MTARQGADHIVAVVVVVAAAVIVVVVIVVVAAAVAAVAVVVVAVLHKFVKLDCYGCKHYHQQLNCNLVRVSFVVVVVVVAGE